MVEVVVVDDHLFAWSGLALSAVLISVKNLMDDQHNVNIPPLRLFD
jgi:hypothetical protein